MLDLQRLPVMPDGKQAGRFGVVGAYTMWIFEKHGVAFVGFIGALDDVASKNYARALEPYVRRCCVPNAFDPDKPRRARAFAYCP